MKKRIISFCIVVAVLLGLIALLPYPQRIERTFYGINSFNGEKANISFDMTFLRFLFKRDRMCGEVTVTCGGKKTLYTENDLQYIGYWPLDNEDKTLHYLGGFYWNTDIVTYNDKGEKDIGDFESIRAYLSKDFSKIVIYHEPSEKAEDTEPKQYIGNIEENKEEETKQYFGRYIK